MAILRKFRKFIHWKATPRPEISLDGQLYEELRPFTLPIILVQMCLIIGTLGYIYIEDYTLIDAIFQTGYTFTTVGFGSLGEEEFSANGKIFSVTLILIGFTVLTFSVGVVVEVINKGELIKIIKERSMLYKIARLKNHFVICYHNEYTIELARQFRKAHVPFVVIDSHENLEAEAKKYKYPYFINDDPHKDIAIRKAYTSSAKGVILLSKNIADNIAQISTIRLFEKEIGRRPYYIISNCEKESDADKLKKLGADSVVSPTKLLGQRISSMAVRPDMENMLETFLYQKEHTLDMEQVEVPKTSWIIFKRLKETHLREITGASIIGIYEKDQFIPMPRGEKQVMIGSKLLVIGTNKTIKEAKRLIKGSSKPEEVKFV